MEEELSNEDALEVDSVSGQDVSDMEMEDEDSEDEPEQLFGEAALHKHVACTLLTIPSYEYLTFDVTD